MQPPATVLAQSALINTVPIHTISFNCADSEANEFLAKLAAETGGRYVGCMFIARERNEGIN